MKKTAAAESPGYLHLYDDEAAKSVQDRKHVHNYPHLLAYRQNRSLIIRWIVGSSGLRSQRTYDGNRIRPSTGNRNLPEQDVSGKWLENLNDWNLSRSAIGELLPIGVAKKVRELVSVR